MVDTTRTLAAAIADARAKGFEIYKLPLAGRIKGYHPGFKKPRKATSSDLKNCLTYGSAVDYAVRVYDETTRRFLPVAGRPRFYHFGTGSDHFILVPPGFDVAAADFVPHQHTIIDANDCGGSE